MKDLVSVIIPCYNSSDCLLQSVESVLSQSYCFLEVIIVDDCSSDDSYDIALSLSLSDKRVQVFRNSENLGPGPTRNFGLSVAKGRYIAFCDSDDFWFSFKLECQLPLFSDPSVAVVCSSYFLNKSSHQSLYVPPPIITYTRLLQGNCIGCSTAVFKVTESFSPRFLSLRSRQDYAFWLQLLESTGIAVSVPIPLVSYTIRPGSVSSLSFSSFFNIFKVLLRQRKVPLLLIPFFFLSHYFRAFLKRFTLLTGMGATLFLKPRN